ncbi:MAG: single-stranded DNA-binding protein [Flavobacteriia bacterium]|nr:single-stranded DNA-binding protein [Flavobacteriia bacterium]
MSAIRNQVTIVGDFGKNPLVTVFESGAMVTRFSVSTENKEAKRLSTRIHQFSMFAWGTTAEFVNKHCRTGKRVAVTGKLVNRTYVNAEGIPRKVTEVEVRQVVILKS